jgi:hypothetical protein
LNEARNSVFNFCQNHNPALATVTATFSQLIVRLNVQDFGLIYSLLQVTPVSSDNRTLTSSFSTTPLVASMP